MQTPSEYPNIKFPPSHSSSSSQQYAKVSSSNHILQRQCVEFASMGRGLWTKQIPFLGWSFVVLLALNILLNKVYVIGELPFLCLRVIHTHTYSDKKSA